MRDEQAIVAKRQATIAASGRTHADIMAKARATRRERELAAGVPICGGDGCNTLLRGEGTRERGLCRRCDKEWIKSYHANYAKNNAERLGYNNILRSGVRAGVAREIREAATGCELCGGSTDVVDHNHETGAVRGVLCHYCNTRLGMLEAPDFESWRLRAVAYLEKYN